MKSETTPTFSDKLNHLFASRKKPDGNLYTNDEVSKAIGLTGAAISKMRNGLTKNPGLDGINKLAKFFAISPAYFFPDFDPESVNQELSLVALRANELGPEWQQVLLDMIDQILKQDEKKH